MVPRLSLEQLVAGADQIAIGRVIRSSCSWGTDHKYIWTRYEIAVDETLKGAAEKTITISEPGGELDGEVMLVSDSVVYTPGERIAVFLKRYPSGLKRTEGWAQGRFSIDRNGMVHAPVLDAPPEGARPEARVPDGSAPKSTPPRTAGAFSVAQFRNRVAAAAQAGAQK